MGVRRFFLFLVTCILLSQFTSGSQETTEWTLKVSSEKAAVRLAPRLTGAIITTLTTGTTLQAYEKTGAWFRVIITTEKSGQTVVGYIFSKDVEILSEEAAKERDFWAEAPEDVRIRGITAKIGGGVSHFSGGDMKSGLQGIWDEKADDLLAQGYVLEGGLEPFRQAFEFTVDIIYQVLPNLGIGLGSGYSYGTQNSGLYFNSVEEPWKLFNMAAKPSIRAIPIRLGVYYTLPIHKLFSISASGGAALYRAEYLLDITSVNENVKGLDHQAATSGFGFFGSLGVELKLERRAYLFLECLGRLAKFSGFTGTETIIQYFPHPTGIPYTETSETKGTLYYLENDGGGRLAVFKDKPALNGTAREAVFNFSGLGIRVGLKFTF